MHFRHVMVIFLLAQPIPSIGTDRKTQKLTLLIAHREEVLYWGIVKLQFTEKKSLSKNEVLLVNVKNKFEDCTSNCQLLKFIDRGSHMCRLSLSFYQVFSSLTYGKQVR